MARIEHAMEINAPAHTVYDQLLRFEEYPRFMESVRAVRRIDDRHLRWHAQAGSHDVEWDVEITQQVPGQCIAWRMASDARHAGRIELEESGEPQGMQSDGGPRTKLRLLIDCNAVGSGAADVESSAMMARRAERDLVRFKKCVESQAPGLRPVHSAPPEVGKAVMARMPDAGGIAYRRRPMAEEVEPNPVLGMRPPWLPVFFPAWESPLQIVRRLSQGMDKIVDGVMAGARLDAHRAAGSANDACRNGGAWSPLVEVARSDDSVVVLAELAGVRREDVRIDIRADRLMIEGDRRPQPPNHPGEARRSERSYGHFYRVVDLPLGADPEAATASMRDGLLEIKVPVRRAAAECRRLHIQTPE